MLANYHTHTTRCNHATGTEREYIEAAIDSGFEILGFSDHVPQPYPEDYYSHIRMRMSEAEGYTDTLVKLKEEYKNDIKILIGYEVEYSRKYFRELLDFINQFPLDYIIQGQHFIPDEIDGFYAGAATDNESHLIDYIDTTIEGMATGTFTYLAHPDLINYTGDDETYQKHMRRLITASINFNIPLEINMLGFIEGRHYPCDRFFSLASDMGAKFIIGCDAHSKEAIRQPEDIPSLMNFFKRNNITLNDNKIKLVHPN